VSRVARRYSKALFETALEGGKLEIIASDLQTIGEVLDESQEFNDLMQNPLIQTHKKVRIIDQLFKQNLDQLTFNFLQLLCHKKRSDIIPAVISNFNEQLLEHKGIISGTIISSKPLTDEQFRQIHDIITSDTGKTVQLSQNVDQELIGGFVVRIKDTVIDLSVKNQLDKLRNKMVFG